MKTSPAPVIVKLTADIDKLGRLKAKVATLALEEKALKEAVRDGMLALNVHTAEAGLFRAVLSYAERETLNAEEARKLLPKSLFPALYSSTLVETLRVGARNAMGVDAPENNNDSIQHFSK